MPYLISIIKLVCKLFRKEYSMKQLDYLLFNAWLALDYVIPVIFVAGVAFIVWQMVLSAIEQWKNL